MGDEGEAVERAALRARADALELEIADARRRIASLQALSEPLGLPSSKPAKEGSRVRVETRLARPVPDRALEGFVAALQERLGVVGWSRADATELVWRSSAAGTRAEVRLVRDEEGSALALDVDLAPLLQTARTAATGVVVMLVMTGFFLAATESWIGASVTAIAIAAMWPISRWWTARRRAKEVVEVERLSAAVVADLEAASTRVRVADTEQAEEPEGAVAVEVRDGISR